MLSLLFVILLLIFNACTSDLGSHKPIDETVNQANKAVPHTGSHTPNITPAIPSASQEMAQKQDNCQALPAGVKLPYYVQSLGVVLIAFQKTCETVDGQAGFSPGSSWTAMGFPCTAGHGRIDKKGSDNVPSVVSFHLHNSCPMQPNRQEEVEEQLRKKLALPSSSHLIAYYPLSVDYWEFVDLPERDVGLKPEIFIPSSINTGWQKFSTKSEPLKLRLYGRENAWERGKQVYEVEAVMVSEGRSSFKLQVQKVRALNEQQRSSINDRCEALRPKRNCEAVFVP